MSDPRQLFNPHLMSNPHQQFKQFQQPMHQTFQQPFQQPIHQTFQQPFQQPMHQTFQQPFQSMHQSFQQPFQPKQQLPERVARVPRPLFIVEQNGKKVEQKAEMAHSFSPIKSPVEMTRSFTPVESPVEMTRSFTPVESPDKMAHSFSSVESFDKMAFSFSSVELFDKMTRSFSSVESPVEMARSFTPVQLPGEITNPYLKIKSRAEMNILFPHVQKPVKSPVKSPVVSPVEIKSKTFSRFIMILWLGLINGYTKSPIFLYWIYKSHIDGTNDETLKNISDYYYFNRSFPYDLVYHPLFPSFNIREPIHQMSIVNEKHHDAIIREILQNILDKPDENSIEAHIVAENVIYMFM
jgi:hypothetical protein